MNFKEFDDQYAKIRENIFLEKLNNNKSDNYQKIYSNLININPHDDEHLIFESINSKGMSLSSSDLIRNFILSKLNEKDFNNFEKIMHKNIGTNSNDLDDFYCQILAIKTGQLFKKNGKKLYIEFRKNYFYFNANDNNYIIKSSLIWYQIHEIVKDIKKQDIKYYPLLYSNLLNYYSIIHVSIEKNSNIDIENLSITINNKGNVNFMFMFLSKLVVSRTLVSFGRVEGNRTYPSLSFKLNNSFNKNGSDFENLFLK